MVRKSRCAYPGLKPLLTAAAISIRGKPALCSLNGIEQDWPVVRSGLEYSIHAKCLLDIG
jgi:hypothetical protein